MAARPGSALGSDDGTVNNWNPREWVDNRAWKMGFFGDYEYVEDGWLRTLESKGATEKTAPVIRWSNAEVFLSGNWQIKMTLPFEVTANETAEGRYEVSYGMVFRIRGDNRMIFGVASSKVVGRVLPQFSSRDLQWLSDPTDPRSESEKPTNSYATVGFFLRFPNTKQIAMKFDAPVIFHLSWDLYALEPILRNATKNDFSQLKYVPLESKFAARKAIEAPSKPITYELTDSMRLSPATFTQGAIAEDEEFYFFGTAVKKLVDSYVLITIKDNPDGRTKSGDKIVFVPVAEFHEQWRYTRQSGIHYATLPIESCKASSIVVQGNNLRDYMLDRLSKLKVQGIPLLNVLLALSDRDGEHCSVVITGGSVRDFFLRKEPQDIDLVVGGTYTSVVRRLNDFYVACGKPLTERILLTGMQKFGQMKVMNAEDEPQPLDVALYKFQVYHPDPIPDGEISNDKYIYGGSYHSDIKFRDYTMNAIYLDVFRDLLVYPPDALTHAGYKAEGDVEAPKPKLALAYESFFFSKDLGGQLRFWKQLASADPISRDFPARVNGSLIEVLRGMGGENPEVFHPGWANFFLTKLRKKLFKKQTNFVAEVRKWDLELSPRGREFDKSNWWVFLKLFMAKHRRQLQEMMHRCEHEIAVLIHVMLTELTLEDPATVVIRV